MRIKFVLIILLFLCVACSTGTGTTGTSGGSGGGTETGDGDTGGGNNADNGGDTATGTTATRSAAIVANHTSVSAFSTIPTSYVTTAKTLPMYYGHTSHGSQLITGMTMLGSPYNSGLSITENEGADLGTGGGTDWADTTREYLNTHSTTKVVMWSWCGGASEASSADINTYLSTMNQLETEYPSVTFVYMTGHTDGSGLSGRLHTNNNLIRTFCNTYKKVLYDFEDIESYDPSGHNYSSNMSGLDDGCTWCTSWCGANPSSIGCPDDGSCAHQPSINCYVKGKAFWWLMARLAGWSG